jgi:hypothetical protein
VSDDQGGYPGAPPDWYADPAGGPGKRWWDGHAWTEGVVLPSQPPAPMQPPPPPGSPGQPSGEMPGYGNYGTTSAWGSSRGWGGTPASHVSGLLSNELSTARVGRLAVPYFGIFFLWQYVYFFTERNIFKSIRAQFHRALRDAQHHQPVPQIHVPANHNGALVGINAVLTLIFIAAIVIACIWQHRAATVGRAMGYPAKHTPGWGVGSWFVPIVDFWMPYQAIRDCMAPDDPNRSVVKRFWFCVMGHVAMLVSVTTAALISGGPASTIFSIVGVCFSLGIVVNGALLVRRISESHRAAAGGSGLGAP